jgi:hypothetical protein
MKDIFALLQPIRTRFQNHFAAVEPHHPGDDCHDGVRNNAGTIMRTEKAVPPPERAKLLLHGHPLEQVFRLFFQVSFSTFSQNGCFKPHSSCQRACFFRLVGEGIEYCKYHFSIMVQLQ